MIKIRKNVLCLSIVIVVGMVATVFAEPLLTTPEPFSQETPESATEMLIEVQELSAPLEAHSDDVPRLLSPAREEHRVDVEEEFSVQTPETSVVPEPSTLLLVGLGLFGLLGALRRRKRR